MFNANLTFPRKGLLDRSDATNVELDGFKYSTSYSFDVSFGRPFL